MAKLENLTGYEFGFWKVIDRAPDKITPSGQKRKIWICECKLCGAKKEIAAQSLKGGTAKKCGCLPADGIKRERNIKVCVECGRPFACPPSDSTVTCSDKCRKIHAKKRQTGVKRSDETRKKISVAAKGRDMSCLQSLAVEAVKASPKTGKFKTNVNAKDWHLISPDGKHFRFRSLNFWLRENCAEFFGCEPDSRGFMNAASGLRHAKRAVMGKASKNQRPCGTYKGWQVVPTDDDAE